MEEKAENTSDEEVDEKLFYTQAAMDKDETVEEFMDKEKSIFISDMED